MLFKTQFDVHKTDFTLIVTEKFCLMSIIYCFVLFWFPFYFSVLFCFVFFTAEMAMNRRWDFSTKMLLSTCIIPLWLDRFNNFNTTLFSCECLRLIQLPLTLRHWLVLQECLKYTVQCHHINCWTMNVLIVTCTISEILMICRKA